MRENPPKASTAKETKAPKWSFERPGRIIRDTARRGANP